MPRAKGILSAAAAGVLLAGGLGGYMVLSENRKNSAADEGARSAAELLATSWSQRKVQDARFIGTTGAAAAENFRTAMGALGRGPVKVTVDAVQRDGNIATANLRVRWTMRNGQPFEWVDPVSLARAGGSWGVKVEEGKSLWHPKLGSSGSFSVSEADADRGEILGRGGAKIMANQPVYDIKLDPAKATADDAATLGRLVGNDGLTGELAQAKSSGSKALITVITYRDADYRAKENAISAVTSAVVTKRTQPLAETRTFGQPLLGTVGPVTAEMIKKDPNTFRAGMLVGRSGLQKSFDKTLSPKGGLTVTVTGQPDTVLFGSKPKAGTSVQTTLDPRVQRAAEKALASAGDSSPTALVAIDVRSGDVLAVANSPSSGINRALVGQYQPGSTLKVSTTYALLTNGFNPNTAVPCPPSIVVDGRRIGNFEQETLPAGAPFTESFAISCNTAFVSASAGLRPTAMQDAARSLGVGVDWTKQLGVPAYTGSVPPTEGRVDHAATSFGQARTLASPMSIAVMSASIARGSYIPPQLLVRSGTDRTPKPLNGSAVQQIQGMMRKVATDGTGKVLNDTPGGAVFAKTGTAEFSEGGKPISRAWLTGWQGSIAFAVLVETVPLGSGGGDRAAPVAKDFLTTLANG